MTYSVHQHWDPLKACIVGRSYPPEFYHWITVPHVRELFEKIARETEEDYQAIISKLEEFGVEVLRPDLPVRQFEDGKFLSPRMIMNPRDYTVMIGDRFYISSGFDFKHFYDAIKDPSWPDCDTLEEFETLPEHIKKECLEVHDLDHHRIHDNPFFTSYSKIVDHVKAQGNKVITALPNNLVNGSMVARIGKDLFFGTHGYNDDIDQLKDSINKEFPDTRNHIVNTGGHSDATYCPVCPGLIISLKDVPTYADTYPGWEVVYLPNQSWELVKPFHDLRNKNQGKWWIPGFEYDNEVVNIVETWLSHWTGYVEETVFDVNMLVIDPKNVMVFSHNQQVFDALAKQGITAHVVPFRHRYFWDGGIHCVTTDLYREGTQQDFFIDRIDPRAT